LCNECLAEVSFSVTVKMSTRFSEEKDEKLSLYALRGMN